MSLSLFIFLLRILCKCKEIARQSDKTFVTFGIQFYGECWASELSLEDLLTKTTSSIHCVNVELVNRCAIRQSFDTHARICVGSANSTALYAERMSSFFSLRNELLNDLR